MSPVGRCVLCDGEVYEHYHVFTHLADDEQRARKAGELEEFRAKLFMIAKKVRGSNFNRRHPLPSYGVPWRMS